MATELDRSVQQRRHARALFTKCGNKLETILNDEDKFRPAVSAAFENLKCKFETLSSLDNTIYNQWLDLTERNEEDYESLMGATEDYVERWHLLQQNYNAYIKEEDAKTLVDSSGKSSASSKERLKRLFKLPKLELPKFDGDVRKWIHFWGMFKKIHDDDDMDDDVKFQYLSQCMEPGSPAQKIIDSYPPTAANYLKAVEQLQARFGRDELLIEIYVRELLSIVLAQTKSGAKVSITRLYDRLKTQLHALESLGVTSDKYAAMLRPLVESALPVELLKVWERQDNRSTHNDQSSTLNDLLTFLKREAESEERIKISRKDIIPNEPSTSCFTTATKNVKTSALKVINCIFCDDSSHTSADCQDAKKMSYDDRIKAVRIKNACKICLRVGHWHRYCRNRQIKCTKCGRRHIAIMHPPESVKENEIEKMQATLFQSSSATVILPTLSLYIVHKGKKLMVRALLDSGAQRSFVKKDIADKAKLVSIGEALVSHNLFGGVVTKKENRKSYKLTLMSCDDKFMTEIEALEQPTICQMLPKADANILAILKQKGIHINDTANEDIDLLIGADNLGSIMTGKMITLRNNLIAIETKFGWTIHGPSRNATTCDDVNLNFIAFDVEDLWKLETLGIDDDAKSKTKTQNEVLEFYKSTVRINEENRYEVKLPFKDVVLNLPTNYNVALKRLKSNTARLIQLGILDEYHRQFVEWEENSIIEKTFDANPNFGHYLPHHAVVKEESLTTKIRPVFDASCCQNVNGLSLNSCLETGQNLIEFIPPLLLKFRKGSIGVTSDVKKAFLQISFYPEDRDYVKFLWWKDIQAREDNITYRHRRVVFGVTTRPFLLMATINHHLEQYNTDTSAKLKQSFYCDNCVTSVDDEESLEKFVSEAKKIMLEGKFELRCWVSSYPKMLDESVKETSILGLKWDPRSDELYCKVPDVKYKKLTKRTLLSLAQSIFDPIGFVSPYTLIPKILVQKCWKEDIDWDSKLPDDLQKETESWLQNIQLLNKCRIPRPLTHANIKLCHCTLHTFSDASASAFLACVFLRAEYDRKVSVQLLLAKSRVTPTKSITMPRLELIAALLATRLAAEAKKALNKEVECEYYWTDSSIVLSWIKKGSNLNVFVHNRITEIKTKTKSQDWRHIPGNLNPADLPSRGCNAVTLLNSKWWEGPTWLKSPFSEWPQIEVQPDLDQVMKEVKKCCLNVRIEEKFSDRLTYFSKYVKTVNMLAWCIRFSKNCQIKAKKEALVKDEKIQSEEYRKAEKTLFRLIQSEEFSNIEATKKSLNMELYEDRDKLLRVKTRLTLTEEKYNFISPILLPGSNLTVMNLVRHCHVKSCHAGVQILINIVREEYWILGIRRLAKKIIKNCMPCKKLNAKMCSAPTAPLPADRLRCGHAFDVTGIDLAGPLILRSREKVWIVLFTCATYRAIHLELVDSLSTETFMLALRRFIARRGKPNVIYSDNGTNFKGAANLLRESSVDRIVWHFIPPQAPWWGGFWERLVKMVKDMMRRILGKASLDRVALYTVLCEIEGVLNNRPLTANLDSDNLVPLTPNDFIVPNKRRDTNNLDQVDLNTRAKRIVKLREDFKMRFRNEYLSLLIYKQQKGSGNAIRPGDIVIVEIQNAKRVNWPLARVIEVFPGVDGQSRAARLRLGKSSEVVRPVQRLYALELRADEPAAHGAGAGGC